MSDHDTADYDYDIAAHGPYVYVIQSGGRTGPVKIGFAGNPVERLAQLQTGNPNQLKLRLMVRGTKQHERELQRKARPYRINGEWFRYEGAVRFVIRNYERREREHVDRLFECLHAYFDAMDAGATEAEAREVGRAVASRPSKYDNAFGMP